MAVAHQGVEVKDIPGVKTPPKMPESASAQSSMARASDTGAAAPPILTRRGADILVQVEKAMDDAAKTLPDAPPPAKPTASTTAQPFPDNLASAAGDGTSRKN
jgi:penicillin-binding protein 1A